MDTKERNEKVARLDLYHWELECLEADAEDYRGYIKALEIELYRSPEEAKKARK